MGNNCLNSLLSGKGQSNDPADSESRNETAEGDDKDEHDRSSTKLIESEDEVEKALEAQSEFELKALSNKASFESLARSSACSSFSRNSLVRYEVGENIFKHLNQNINSIREKRRKFEDPYFMRTCSSIVINENSKLYISLKSRLGARDLKQLNKQIIWRRTEDIVNIINSKEKGKSLANEFVLDEDGKGPKKRHGLQDYMGFFWAHDIFQGWIGNCFHIGAMMGITRNEDLLLKIIPADNLLRTNMDICAYHFRFWRLGKWYDVVVDDYLPTNNEGQLIFSRNEFFPNEFWVPLFEKAFAKFVGNYDELEGGLFENSALYLSGGLHEVFNLATCLTMSKEPVAPQSPGTNKLDTTTDRIKLDLLNIRDEEHPNVTELFEIIKFALIRQDMVGCSLENEEIAQKYGFHKEHFYLISSVQTVENVNYIKIHNPFNKPDKFKSTNEHQEIEQILSKNGERTTMPGEFWLQFDKFMTYFKLVKICNLQPEKCMEDILLKPSTSLKRKSNIFTKWNIQTFNNQLPAAIRNISWNDRYHGKYLVENTSTSQRSILVSFIQDWTRRKTDNPEIKLITLRIYILNKQNEWIHFKTESYQASLQWCIKIALQPIIKYLFIYDSVNQLDNDLSYCFRVLSDSESDDDNEEPDSDSIDAKLFDNNPPFKPDVIN